MSINWSTDQSRPSWPTLRELFGVTVDDPSPLYHFNPSQSEIPFPVVGSTQAVSAVVLCRRDVKRISVGGPGEGTLLSTSILSACSFIKSNESAN